MKKALIIFIGIPIVLLGLGIIGSSVKTASSGVKGLATTQPTSTESPTVSFSLTPTPSTIVIPTSKPTPVVDQSANTYTNSYYTNSDGNKVQSPTHYDSAPAGATAKCRDGTYSFSQHRSGTCSHHGGVDIWY